MKYFLKITGLNLIKFAKKSVIERKIQVEEKNIIIYNTQDGKTSVSLLTKENTVWMNQNQLAELFATPKQNIGQNIASILKDNELDQNLVVKNYFTTAR